MTEADLLDQVIRHAELACLGSMEALQDVCNKVFIMVRLRRKHHSRIQRGGILAATVSAMKRLQSTHSFTLSVHLGLRSRRNVSRN